LTDRSKLPQTGRHDTSQLVPQAYKLIVLVTDVGAPVALHELLLELPDSFPVPIIALQPTENVLIEANSNALERTVPFKVRMLVGRETLKAGFVYVGMSEHTYKVYRENGNLSVDIDSHENFEWPAGGSLVQFSRMLGKEMAVAFLSTRIDSFKLEHCISEINSFESALICVDTANADYAGLLKTEMPMLYCDDLSQLAGHFLKNLKIQENIPIQQSVRR